MSKSMTVQTKQSKPSKTGWKPHAYQKKAMKFMLENCCAGLLLDPGLGKTSISLGALKILKKEGMLGRALIIAPLRVCYSVWPKEIEKWSDFEDLSITVLHGKDKEKNLAKHTDIAVINPEGLSWLFKHKDYRKSGFNILIVDESSKFKDTSTQRFKTIRPLLQKFDRRYILTGSVAPNGLLDLFGQIYILDLGASLGSFITHYRTKFFYPTGFGGYEWKLQPGADKRIQDAIRPMTLRLDAEDHLKMPKLIVNPVYIDLPPDARKIYDEMEDELFASVKSNEITAATAAVASGKCSQIANGGLYDNDGNTLFIHDAKAQAVAGLVAELNGTPALIAYEYEHDLHRLRKVLGKHVPHIGGGVTPKASAAIEAKWNASELPELLGQPASMAHGLNLQNAGNHAIWHSLIWNYEYYDQFNRRIRRQGSKHETVYVHHIIARNTVDEIKIMNLNSKHHTQKDLYDALNTYMSRRIRER